MNYFQAKAARKSISSAHGTAREEFIRSLQDVSQRHDLFRVWSDFLEMAAISLSNSVDRKRAEVREARYMQIVKGYSREELDGFARAFACLVQAMGEEQFGDVLGQTFMALGLGNKWAGQFFTPYPVCVLMARMSLETAEVARCGFVSVSDPCVGGGAMPIATAHALYDEGLNPQRVLHVTGQDIDSRAVHMAFLQLSLLHIPAVVIHGNSLGPRPTEDGAYWFTPAHILGGWSGKLRARNALHAVRDLERTAGPELPDAPACENISSPWPFPRQTELFE